MSDMNDNIARAHVGENAELYALGLLEARERAAIDAHVAGCSTCMRRVGEAEETAAILAQSLPRYAVSPRLAERLARAANAPEQVRAGRPVVVHLPRRVHPAWFAGMAAVAAAIAITFSGYETFRERSSLQTEEVALATVARSHFFHQTLANAAPSDSLTAKVLYARDGAWFYVIVDEPPPALHVMETVGGVERDLGPPLTDGRVETLFVPNAGHPSQIELRSGSTPVASARLTYAP